MCCRELDDLKEIAIANVWKTFQQLIQGAEELKLVFAPEMTELVAYCRETDVKTAESEKKGALKAALLRLKNDSTIACAVQRSHEFKLLDSAPYWLTHLERVLGDSYMPTSDDALRTRQATCGVIETDFHLDGATFQFIDVGGQRGERRKWIHCFDQISAMFYVCALSEYCQVLEEDPNQNRLQESLSLFRGLLGLPWFSKTPVILFLNKADVFRVKIPLLPMKLYFDDFEPAQGEDLIVESTEFVRELFEYQAQNVPTFQEMLYCHVTTATNSDNIKLVWNSAKSIVVNASLRHSLNMQI